MRKTLGLTKRMLRRIANGDRPGRFAEALVAASGIGAAPRTALRPIVPAYDLEDLVACYARGAFANADIYNPRYLYVSEPSMRCILPLDAFHVGATLNRIVKRSAFTVRVDSDLPRLVELCAEPTEERVSTWLQPPLRHVYRTLAGRGIAHSVEVWDGDTLTGGLIGVAVGGVFTCESLVTRGTHASKIALVHLVARLIAGGFAVLDMQYISDHFRRFGGIEIPRAEFRRRLAEARNRPVDFHALPEATSGAEALAIIRAAAAARPARAAEA